MRDPHEILITLVALLIAIPIHEFAHAFSAVKLGDDGPRRDGRLTIFPWDHFDPLGALFCVISSVAGYGIGWGKPVLVVPSRLRNPTRDMAWIAAWGPLSNLILAILFAIPLRFGWVHSHTEGIGLVLFSFVLVNLGLMLFNLIPLGPLDGATVVMAFLPFRLAEEYRAFQMRWGCLILMALILLRDLPILDFLIFVPMTKIMVWLLPNLF